MLTWAICGAYVTLVWLKRSDPQVGESSYAPRLWNLASSNWGRATLCLITVVSDGLPTFSDDTVLLMQRLSNVSWHSDDNPIAVTVLKYWLRWLWHILRSHPREFYIVNYCPMLGLVIKGGQCIIWCRGMEESCKGLGPVGSRRLSDWHPTDSATVVRDVIRHGSKWKHLTTCCNFFHKRESNFKWKNVFCSYFSQPNCFYYYYFTNTNLYSLFFLIVITFSTSQYIIV